MDIKSIKIRIKENRLNNFTQKWVGINVGDMIEVTFDVTDDSELYIGTFGCVVAKIHPHSMTVYAGSPIKPFTIFYNGIFDIRHDFNIEPCPMSFHRIIKIPIDDNCFSFKDAYIKRLQAQPAPKSSLRECYSEVYNILTNRIALVSPFSMMVDGRLKLDPVISPDLNINGCIAYLVNIKGEFAYISGGNITIERLKGFGGNSAKIHFCENGAILLY